MMIQGYESRPQTSDGRPPTHDGLRRTVSDRPLTAADVLQWKPTDRTNSAQDLVDSAQLFDTHGRVNLPPSQLEMPPTPLPLPGIPSNASPSSAPDSPSSGRPSSAQLKLAVARGMAAVAEAGIHTGESQDNILVGMRFAGRLMAEQAVKTVMEDDSNSAEDIEGLSQKVEGYIADMMNAGQRLSSAGTSASYALMSLDETAGTGSGSSGVPPESLVTLSSTSEEDDAEDEEWISNDGGEARDDDDERDLMMSTYSPSASAPLPPPLRVPSASPGWEVKGVMEAWTEQRDMAATVGAAIGSFCEASSEILDHMQARLDEGAAAAAAPMTGWGSPDSAGGGGCPLSPVEVVKKDGKRKGSDGKRRAVAAIQEDVKLVATHAGEFRCAAVCGDKVWLADRGGRIEIRSRSPKFSTAGGKVSKVPAVLHCIPAEMDNLVWCLQPVGRHQMWVGQEVGPIRVYNAKSYEKVAEVTWHQGGVTCMVSTTRGAGASASAQRRVFTGSLDFSICCWHAKTLKKEAVLKGHSNGVRCLLVLGSTLWSGSDDTTIRVWDILGHGGTPECIAVLEGHRGGVLSLVVAGQGVWSGSEDGTIQEWSVTGSRSCLRKVTETDRISTLVPMGLNHVWACGQEPSVTVWDTHTMQPVHRLAGHLSWVNMLVKVEHTETRMLWSASMSDKSLRVWQHKNSIDNSDVLNINELTAANEVLADEAAGLRRKLDIAQVMSETAQEAAIEVTNAANRHLENLQAVAEDATEKATDAEVELEELRRRVAELDQAVSDGLDREEALQTELNLERKETSRLRSRAQEERSVNSDLRGDNEALMAETERLIGDKDAMQAELTHVQTRLRVMKATMGATAAEHDADADGQDGTEDDSRKDDAQTGNGSEIDEVIPNGDSNNGSEEYQEGCLKRIEPPQETGEESGNDKSDGVGDPVSGDDADVLSPPALPSADAGENCSIHSDEDCDIISQDGYSSVMMEDDEEGNDDHPDNADVPLQNGDIDAP